MGYEVFRNLKSKNVIKIRVLRVKTMPLESGTSESCDVVLVSQ